MTRADAAVHGAIAVSVVGMMLVVAGVIAEGFFLPGVVLIVIGMIGFAAAAVLHAIAAPAGDAVDARR
jgi:hypothetical protein